MGNVASLLAGKPGFFLEPIVGSAQHQEIALSADSSSPDRPVYAYRRIGNPELAAIFVETAVGHGFYFRVIQGKTKQFFQRSMGCDPEHTGTAVQGSKTLIGRMRRADLARLTRICNTTIPLGSVLDPNCAQWVEQIISSARADGILG